MRRHTPVASLGMVAALLSLTLVACSAGQGSDPTATDPDATTATPAPDAGCELDLASTAFGPYTALNQIPTIAAEGTEPNDQFWAGYPLYQFTIEDNQFDPCAELSWVQLSGTTFSDGSEPADASDAVVFFHRDQLLTDPLPVQVAANLRVERLAENQLEVTFGHYAAPGQAVTQELRSIELTWDNDEPVLDDAAWYTEYSAAHTRLDLTSPPPGSDAPVLPLGNAHNSPFQEEFELATYPGSNFRIPLSETSELRCILRFPAEQSGWGWIGCLGDNADWPLSEPEFGTTPDPAPLQPASEGPPNYLQISYMPAMLASSTVDQAAATAIPFDQTVADEALTRIEHYVVDTRGDQVTISYGGTGVTIRPDGFDTTTVHLIDRSRWEGPAGVV